MRYRTSKTDLSTPDEDSLTAWDQHIGSDSPGKRDPSIGEEYKKNARTPTKDTKDTKILDTAGKTYRPETREGIGL